MYCYVSEIRPFAFGITPQGWLPCNGQTLNIMQNQALYSLIGIKYGGDGQTTFKLPNLNGSTLVATSMVSAAPSGTVYPYASIGGAEKVTITAATMPPHSHQFNTVPNYEVATPNTNFLGNPNTPVNPNQTNKNAASSSLYVNALGASTSFPANAITNAGGGQPHENRQPYLPINYCIAVTGYYPPRD